MQEDIAAHVRDRVDAIYRSDSRRVLATLIRLLGDFDLAEEALHDAFATAVEQWAEKGIPENPRTWLISTGRFKAIDRLRKSARFESVGGSALERLEAAETPEIDEEGVEDDRLRLIFTCCHPALSADAQIALTLREVCGLTTEEVAHAFLTPPPTLAQRIVRAKGKIRDARIPYEIPSRSDLPSRLDSVLHVIYLVFNEGYLTSSGASLTRADLSGEAIRLGRLLVELLPEPEAMGLLALMILHEARRPSRTTPSGEMVLLEDQDRSLWNRAQIEEGVELVERALGSHRFGPYTLQAAIAAVHAEGGGSGRHRLDADSRVVRRAVEGGPIAGDRAQSRGSDRDARWTRGGARSDRCDSRAWRSDRVSPRPRGAWRSLPETRSCGRRDRCLLAGA